MQKATAVFFRLFFFHIVGINKISVTISQMIVRCILSGDPDCVPFRIKIFVSKASDFSASESGKKSKKNFKIISRVL